MTDQYRLGIDIGGTFTDGILLNETTGEIRTAKVPSTRRSIGRFPKHRRSDVGTGFPPLHVLQRMCSMMDKGVEQGT